MNILNRRCVFSGFSKEDVQRKQRILEGAGIETEMRSHSSNSLTGTFGQLEQYQVAYDLYVGDKDFDAARALLGGSR